MKFREIVENLNRKADSRSVRKFVRKIEFRTRFNTLRELIYHADIYLAEGKLEQCDQILKVAEKISRYLDEDLQGKVPEKVRSLKIITRKKRAKYFEARGDLKEAIARYKLIINMLNLPDEEPFLAEMLMEVGILQEQLGKKKEALDNFTKSIRIYKDKKDDFNFEAALFNCAHVLYDLNFFYKAEEFCRTVIRHYKRKKKMMSPVAHSYLEMANIKEIQEKEEEAKMYYNKALESYRSLNLKVKVSDILNRIGSYEIDENNVSGAIRFFNESLDIKLDVDFTQGKAEIYEIIGDQLRYCNNLEDALAFYNTAYDMLEKSGANKRKIVIKHKIFKIVKHLELTSKDLGTFVEEFKRKEMEIYGTSLLEKLQRVEYRELGGDGAKLETIREWKIPRDFQVNRKFLLYVLRNLSRAHSRLDNQDEFLKYSRMREFVEKNYRKKNQ